MAGKAGSIGDHTNHIIGQEEWEEWGAGSWGEEVLKYLAVLGRDMTESRTTEIGGEGISFTMVQYGAKSIRIGLCRNCSKWEVIWPKQSAQACTNTFGAVLYFGIQGSEGRQADW